jgi:hypothetical protein
MKTAFIAAITITVVLSAAHLRAANQQQLTGIISDAMCGASHMMEGKTPAECTRECVKEGSKYVLVVGDKVYTLNGHEAELDKLAGEKAVVKGDVSGDKVQVQSVAPAQGK